MSHYFITGTDTNAGKTTVSCALLDYYHHHGLSTLALKPVATGCDIKQLKPEDDIFKLQHHMSLDLSAEDINHFYHPTPAAPSIANPEHPPRVAELTHFCRQRMQDHPTDITLIEGAGGWLCPLNANETLSQLPQQLQAPTILVVGLTLGCINHALLSEFHVKQDGQFVGWIANFRDSDIQHSQEMLEVLQQHMTTPLIATLGHTPSTSRRNPSLKVIEPKLLF